MLAPSAVRIASCSTVLCILRHLRLAPALQPSQLAQHTGTILPGTYVYASLDMLKVVARAETRGMLLLVLRPPLTGFACAAERRTKGRRR
jgi:hypothetical protein